VSSARANCSFGWLGKLIGQVLVDSDIASEHARNETVGEFAFVVNHTIISRLPIYNTEVGSIAMAVAVQPLACYASLSEELFLGHNCDHYFFSCGGGIC
jgi:hypothetical protein